MSVFECYFTLWVALCIVVGITLSPGVFRAIGSAEIGRNLPTVG